MVLILMLFINTQATTNNASFVIMNDGSINELDTL